MPNPTCPTCGDCVDRSSDGYHRVYCSPLCQRRRKRGSPRAKVREDILCAGCGEMFTPGRKDATCCSRRCWNIARGLVRPAPLAPRACELPACRATYQPSSTLQRCCCDDHVRRLWRIENADKIKAEREPWGDKGRERYHRRRALKKGASVSGRPVVFSEIALRDGWCCHLCGRPVRPRLAYPDPMSGSLDHVIPLSKGGAHDPINVRLAHLRCNVSKGNREAVGQLLPFG